MQLVVLGMHRAGTSVVTRLINMLGAYVGGEGTSLGFSVDNPKGYWERRDVMAINESLLRLNGWSWNEVPSSDADRRQATAELRTRIRSLVLDLDAHRPWVIKDPRLCLTLPYWSAYLEVPVAVVVYRDPMEIAASLARRDGMSIEGALQLWEYYSLRLLEGVRRLPTVFVDYGAVLSAPTDAIRTLRESLRASAVTGLRKPSEREVSAFVSRSLYRSRAASASYQFTNRQRLIGSALQGDIAAAASLVSRVA